MEQHHGEAARADSPENLAWNAEDTYQALDEGWGLIPRQGGFEIQRCGEAGGRFVADRDAMALVARQERPLHVKAMTILRKTSPVEYEMAVRALHAQLVRQALALDPTTPISRLASARKAALEQLRLVYDREGPYQVAKERGLLVRGSAEEFAIAFMSAYNSEVGLKY